MTKTLNCIEGERVGVHANLRTRASRRKHALHRLRAHAAWRPLEKLRCIASKPKLAKSQSSRGLAFKPKLMALAPQLTAPAYFRPINFAKA